MSFYSARISVLCVTPGGIPEDGYTVDIQVHILTASNFTEAFSKALSIGTKEEVTYKNMYDENVRWVFKEIEAITHLGDDIDGKEVSSRMEGYFPSKALNESESFDPENSKPIYSDNALEQ